METEQVIIETYAVTVTRFLGEHGRRMVRMRSGLTSFVIPFGAWVQFIAAALAAVAVEELSFEAEWKDGH